MSIMFPWSDNKKQQPQPPINTTSVMESMDLIEKEGVTLSNNKINDIKDFIVKCVGYLNNQTYRREKFERCEYNLAEIRDASEADSYIKVALAKYSYLIYKAGWRLKSDNQEAIDYLMKRFRIMSYAMDKPMDILFQEIADDLVRYSNAFLIKSRVDNIPGVKAVGIVDSKKPIGGYCRVDPSSIRIKRDKCGNVLKYEQGRGENKKQWFREDVIHIYMDKDANNAFGTPRIIAALDDVKLLRKIEGNVVALIHRFSMPLYQWKIGIPQPGFQATRTEIQDAKRNIESSSLDGLVITNEKTEIKSIGAEGSALNAYQYLQYFESRVFSALDVSASQMGRSGVKQDADSMEAQVHDTVKHMQRVLKAFYENFILTELLLEGGFNIFESENVVEYVFEEISLDTKIKQENHEMVKYQSNLTTHSEARRRIGMKDECDDEQGLYQRKIADQSSLDQIDRNGEWQERLAHINNEAAMQQAKVSAANRASSSSSSSSSKSSGTNKNSTSKSKSRNTSQKKQPNGAATNTNRPTNQHGTTSVKIKESAELNSYLLRPINVLYNQLLDNDESNKEVCTRLINIEIKKILEIESLDSMNLAINDLNELDDNVHLLLEQIPASNKINDHIEKNINNIAKQIWEEYSNNNNDLENTTLLDSYKKDIDDIIINAINIIRKYSYIYTGKKYGIEQLSIKYPETEEIKIVNINSIKVNDLLDNKYDNCNITFSKRGEK